MAKRVFKVWRGDGKGGDFTQFDIEVDPGMVVLDVLHRIQAQKANDLALRWNCKAGKCGSCSMEINGKPRLACMTRMNSFSDDETITCQPLKTFPVMKDLVTDVSWNYEQNKKIPKFKPRPRDADGTYRMYQEDVDRVQEFRKCIECYLCQDVCHVLRDREKAPQRAKAGESATRGAFVGPRFMIRLASLEMHPLDTDDRVPEIRKEFGSGLCNITRCCTEVCPEHIGITDNGIIPLKERVVDRYFDPIAIVGRKLLGIRTRTKTRAEEASESSPAPAGAAAPGTKGPA
ncbi:MAG TPA: succinate dehydrogenase/fumarate reductase iron-sulfur subunit [Kofleriaceae bacterium]|nr:succinate dehydrogenase/fumarate reductase iron-sulfur subunit [Kofleriaceae bacterium]